MLSLRGNRDDSNSDSDDGSYSSFDESMQNFQLNDTQDRKSNVPSSGNRRQHDFFKRDDEDDDNSSDGMDDTNVVSRLQRFIDSVDKHSYELMSLVRSHDWKAAMSTLEELNKNAIYIASQGTRIPYSFLSALKFSQDFFNQPGSEGEQSTEGEFLSELRQNTPKELRKTLTDFHRDITNACEERALLIEHMDDEDSDDDESESSDVDIEELLNIGGDGPTGEALDESLAAAVLGDKDGFSLATLISKQEITETSIMNKVQELRLKLAGGITEKSTKDSDKRLKRMKRCRSVLFSLAMQSILKEVEHSGQFPKSQALLCSLLFADCFGERRQESVLKHLFKDYRSLTEAFPSIRFGAQSSNVSEGSGNTRHSRLDRTTLRQWHMAAEYMNRYLHVLEKHPDVTKLILAHEDSNRGGSSTEIFGVDISISLLAPFTMASRLVEEYIEAIRSTQLHESSYLGWLQAESILLYMLERTLLIYSPRESQGASSAASHLEQAIHLGDHMLLLLHYRTYEVHHQLYDKYYRQLLSASGNRFIHRDLTESMLRLRKISQLSKATTDFPALALRSTLYLIHNHAVNDRVTEALRSFRVTRCDERARVLANTRTSQTSEEYTRGDSRNRTLVAYNRVLARLGIALFSQGKIQAAGDYIMQLFLPNAQQGTSAHHSVYAKELLLAQISLRHSTALRFSSVPCLEGTGNTEPVVEHRVARITLERSLLPAWKTAIEDVYLPPHLHLNIELLDCIFYVYCMMYQEGTRRGSQRWINEPKPYRAFLNSYERQNFLKAPETNKDLIYAAVVAFRTADWKVCCDRLTEVPLFGFALSENSVLEFTTAIKIECLKKFMLGARGVFTNMRIDHLSTKFSLIEDEVRRVLVQMVVRRELHGAFPDASEAAFVFDHVQHTPLQKSVLQLSEKVAWTIDCTQRAQEYKHMQKLYNHPESFGKGSFFFRNRHRSKGKIAYDGEIPPPTDENQLATDGAMPEHTSNFKETRRIRGGTIRNAPTRNPFATLRGNRFVTR